MLARLCFASMLLAGVACSGIARAQGSGTAVILVGLCEGSLLKSFTLRIRSMDGKERLSVTIPREVLAGGPTPAGAWKDSTGLYIIYPLSLPSGEWEIYNHSMVAKVPLSQALEATSARNDYSHRFQVPANGVAYLGRYCAASQNEAYEWAFGPRNIKGVANTYVLATSRMEVDIKNAKIPGLDGATVMNAAPSDPSAVSKSWRDSFLEPREVVRKESQQAPCTTEPVQPCK